MTSVAARVRGALIPGSALRNAFAAAKGGKLAEAFPILAKAGAEGHSRAQYWVGKGYLEGRGVPASRVTAMAWLHRAADAGEVEAMSVLASGFT